MEVGKSWIVYVQTVTGLALKLGILGALFLYRDVIFSAGINVSLGVISLYGLIYWGILIMAGVVVGKAAYRIALLRSYRIWADDSGVGYRYGVLPWRQVHFTFAPHQLFQATYAHNFWGWLLGYGRVTFVDAKGSTGGAAFSHINNAREITGRINDRIDAGKGQAQ